MTSPCTRWGRNAAAITPSPSQVCGAVAGQTVPSDAPRRDPLHRPVLGPQLRTQGPNHPNRSGLVLRAVTTRGRLPRRGVRRHDSILASKFRSLQALRTHRWGQRPLLMAGSVDHGTRRVGAGLTDAPCLHAGCLALPGGANRWSGDGGLCEDGRRWPILPDPPGGGCTAGNGGSSGFGRHHHPHRRARTITGYPAVAGGAVHGPW